MWTRKMTLVSVQYPVPMKRRSLMSVRKFIVSGERNCRRRSGNYLQADVQIYPILLKIKECCFRNSSKTIGKVCRKFFDHPGHLANHFSYLTSTGSLQGSVGKNLKSQIGGIRIHYILQDPLNISGFLEKYLRNVDKSLEFQKKLEDIETAVQTDYSGVPTYKEIQILVGLFLVHICVDQTYRIVLQFKFHSYLSLVIVLKIRERKSIWQLLTPSPHATYLPSPASTRDHCATTLP